MSRTSIHVAFALALCAAGSMASAAESPPVMLDVASAVDGTHQGATVLWGGTIKGRLMDGQQACLRVEAARLGTRDGKPRSDSPAGQLFYACSEQGFDDSKYAEGRLVTVAGTLGPVQERKVQGIVCQPDMSALAYGSKVVPGQDGCVVLVPVVAVVDSRSWLGSVAKNHAPGAL
jgi:starvation-inducible outer membrane lipoprotein